MTDDPLKEACMLRADVVVRAIDVDVSAVSATESRRLLGCVDERQGPDAETRR